MRLYRPCGLEEMALVYDSGLRRWPARLPQQPIFYPVTNQGYAAEINRKWNTREGSRMGYVTAFEVDGGYAEGFAREVVGAKEHEELWVPAEELETFNDHIEGPIEVLEAHFGEGFVGSIPEAGPWAGEDARGQLELMARSLESDEEELRRWVEAHHREIYLHWPFWLGVSLPTHRGAPPREVVLGRLRPVWRARFAEVALPEVAAQRVG